ncbi:MAG TPA: hypothetical protein VM677_09750 [Actinokineospora sp.]|nr:hypothetical protein [Actinokineospora sp.]
MTAAIARRQTDRRRFSSWAVPAGHLDLLVERAAPEGALAIPVTDPLRRYQLAAAIAKAAEQGHSAERDAETALWSGRGRTDNEGVQAAGAPPEDTVHGDTTMRAFTAGTLLPSTVDAEDVDAGELIVLATAGDDPLSRLRAGEAASAALLAATQMGLATCPLSQALEIPETASTIRGQVLDGAAVPQLVLRVGWSPTAAPPPPRSHRRPIDKFTAYLPGFSPARHR